MIATVVEIAAVVDTADLLQVIWTSLVAGIGVTGAFGLVILGGSRAVDLGREGRAAVALLYGALCGVALVTVAAAIVIGLVGLVDK